MTDISKCRNESCPLKTTCWRWLAPENEYRQSYRGFYYDFSTNKCEHYWEVDVKPIEDPNV